MNNSLGVNKINFDQELKQEKMQMVASQAVLKLRKGSLKDRHMRTIQVADVEHDPHSFKIVK